GHCFSGTGCVRHTQRNCQASADGVEARRLGRSWPSAPLEARRIFPSAAERKRPKGAISHSPCLAISEPAFCQPPADPHRTAFLRSASSGKPKGRHAPRPSESPEHEFLCPDWGWSSL